MKTSFKLKKEIAYPIFKAFRETGQDPQMATVLTKLAYFQIMLKCYVKYGHRNI